MYAFCFQVSQIGYELSISSSSGKVIFLCNSFLASLIYSYYTCDLISRMTFAPPAVPIRSFQDVIDGGYSVLYQPSTANHDDLKSAKKGTPMNKFYYEVSINEK